jgi:hypothetical protein
MVEKEMQKSVDTFKALCWLADPSSRSFDKEFTPMPFSIISSIVRVNCVAMLAISHVCLAADATKTATPPSSAKSQAETRFVQFDKASVHCGPAQEHYITSVLERGASVEVYHQTKDGWCGIRPPDGSHDWLAADQAYLLPGGKQAEVVSNKAPAWIGTNSELKDQRFRWQVELQPSQKVDVIGELEQAIDSNKVHLWYKILPPPGEFRWIKSEALSLTPPKIRSTTVTLASSGKKSEQVQHAAFQNVIEREPVPGEYIEGEGIVIGGTPGNARIHEGQVIDEGYVSEGIPSHWNSDEGYIVGDSFDGEPIEDDYVIDGSIVQGEIVHDSSVACPSCSRVGCTTCAGAAHQTDSFQQWDAVEATGNPKLRFRPLGRILGMIGLSVVEGERIPDVGQPCPLGCGCASCIQNRLDLNPRSSGRLNHLPRPVRRIPSHVSSDWLGSNESIQPPLASIDRMVQRNNRSLLEPQLPSQDWRGLDAQKPSVIAASSQAGELHFSTPEIQQAMVDLSRAVAVSMDRWDLREHAVRAQQWIEQASDPIARGEARLLLERIESFEILRRRSQAVAETASMTSTAGLAMNPNTIGSVPASLAGYQRPVGTSLDNMPSMNDPLSTSPTAPQRNPDGTPASDASGWLVQVHSAEYGQPEYALTDDHGGLIAYVQPSPGMNLSRYLKQPVGIYGAKGYLPSLSARQIVAERIVRLR